MSKPASSITEVWDKVKQQLGTFLDSLEEKK